MLRRGRWAGFRGEVIATRETIELAPLVLRDSLQLQGRHRDLKRIDQIRWRAIGERLFRRPRPIGRDLFVDAFRSGHIVGAVSLGLFTGRWGTDEHCRVLFSGDLGNNWRGREVQPWVRRGMVQSHTADLALVESTYGKVVRDERVLEPATRRAQLFDAIEAGLKRGGPVLLPTFGIQRSADLLYDLHLLMAHRPGLWSDVPLLVDGPAAFRFFSVLHDALFRQHQSPTGKVRPVWTAEQALVDFGLDPRVPEQMESGLRHLSGLLRPKSDVSRRVPVRSRDRADRIAEGGRAIVFATGGMASGGPVQAWLARWLRSPAATGLFSGFCSPGTAGRRLLDACELSDEERARHRGQLELGDSRVAVRDVVATIDRLDGYSGHADQAGLVRWCLPPRQDGGVLPVARRWLVQHGEYASRASLAGAIESAYAEAGFPVDVRLPGPEDDAVDARTGAAGPRAVVLGRVQGRIAALRAELARLEKLEE